MSLKLRAIVFAGLAAVTLVPAPAVAAAVQKALPAQCSGTAPVKCHFAVAPGNYDVTVGLGSTTKAANTSMSVEARREVLNAVSTSAGQVVPTTVTVNVRNPEGQPTGQGGTGTPGLDITFGGSAPAIGSLTVTPAQSPLVAYLAGDSTVCDQPAAPYTGWGQVLPTAVRGGAVVANYADSGESSGSFLSNKALFPTLKPLIKSKDLVLIQFGHNDKQTSATAFRDNLTKMVDGVRERGGVPVLVTPPVRRLFSGTKLTSTALHVNSVGVDLPAVIRALGKSANVPVLDLTAKSKALVESLGPTASQKIYLTQATDGVTDNTHFSVYGATQMSNLVVQGVRELNLSLAGYLRPAAPGFATASAAAVNQHRTVTDFDPGWLFNYGDASGAGGASYDDGGWRKLSVPHDWSIEGRNPPASPFSQSAPSTGRGGYLPSGIGWYRKHFSLSGVPAGRRVSLEFDGVMANASVYVNGTLIGTHPYGYTSFRYDITAAAKLGGDNVVAVKTDTSSQPASRYYTGAGIHRDVRLVTTDPVHVGQWATRVTTPNVNTVHAETTVVNESGAAASVSVRGVLSDPGGSALPAVTTAAKTVAAGASATFAYDVPVSNPKLWDLSNPNLYSLATNVLVGGTAVDDDVTSVGIRTLTFNASTGMSLNGKNVKFQGVALHQDLHGLGMAAPQRAIQRRLAQLKALGVNAIRTAHDPPSPAFLELTDRMGFLVLDEFFDVWTQHKYSDAGDYATYFSKTASSPTGTPAVPGASGSVPWYQVDATSVVLRDRNHPSVAMWSTGNEIRDPLSTRTPLLTRMVAIAHALDGRPVTQALFRPGDSGDVTGATRTIVDVFGGNYRPDEVIQAAKTSPARPGLFTEMGTDTSAWTTVRNNAMVTGLFVWTGAAYLGEADGLWPRAEPDFGLMDGVGTVRPIGYSWQRAWGAPTTSPPPTGTTANRVLLSPDHSTVSTDVDDVSYVKATVADTSGRVVTGSSAPVTFTVSGPGVLVAVDSGSPVQESFRGSVRKAYQGVAYALVRATGPGTITVTATSGGLTTGTTTLTGTTAPFVPCSGSCD